MIIIINHRHHIDVKGWPARHSSLFRLLCHGGAQGECRMIIIIFFVILIMVMIIIFFMMIFNILFMMIIIILFMMIIIILLMMIIIIFMMFIIIFFMMIIIIFFMMIIIILFMMMIIIFMMFIIIIIFRLLKARLEQKKSVSILLRKQLLKVWFLASQDALEVMLVTQQACTTYSLSSTAIFF